ncbi:MAG TPA: peptidylprolyl isomerase [Ktedonobacteraceae bacterium]|jgi:parvulin-like peptidyl-prolyl isomerase|nr:peptidylprolyl isomerase [Ktedonobacteraceae bacterium]
MKSQTERPVRQPESKRSTRSSKANKSKRYRRQTARIEARRDGKPLIFGWGKHLSHSEKVVIQRRATWGLTAFIAVLIVAVVVGFWINNNIIQPGLPITSVNGHQIPQSQYRKMVAFKTLQEMEKLYGPHGLNQQVKDLQTQDAVQVKIIDDQTKQIDDLNKQIKALPAGSSAKRTQLNNELKAAQKKATDAQNKHQSLQSQITNLTQTTIPLEQQIFAVPQISSDSVTWLQNDELIREWLANQSSAIQARINPSNSQIDKAMKDLLANIPKTNSYNNLLSAMSVTNDDMRAMMAIKLRRDNMQTYLASQIVSPNYQVLARVIVTDTQQKANNILKQLKAGKDFGTLAKAQSQDPTTSSKGGDLGWEAYGQYAQSQGAAVVENWMFDRSRTINQISPVLKENGSYHIVQILGIDPSRKVDASTLKTLKDNALQDWLTEQQALPSTNITPVDQNKELDPNNLPPTSILPSSPPSQNPNGGAPGAPGLP